MADSQSRPARGRSSARGGRSGHGARGPRPTKQTNGDHTGVDASADQGELGQLKRRYGAQLSVLKDMFPDWTDVDLVLATAESDGDLEAVIEKITEGNVSKFAEVKKAKDRARSKVKEPGAHENASVARGGGRARGSESVRGRARGTDRGRGGFRGNRAGATNGTRDSGAPSVPTVESSAWDVPAAAEVTKNEHSKAGEPTAAEPEAPMPAAGAAPSKKTWASMFAAVPKAIAPKLVAKIAPSSEEAAPAAEAPADDAAHEPVEDTEELPTIPAVADEIAEELPATTDDAVETPDMSEETTGPELSLTPSKDELTKDNVEHLPDVSQPAPTETAASTVASSRDIGSLTSVATPLGGAGQAPIGRPGIGGYAITALKATSGAHRSASFQRRILEQQEAVVMPGNHAVNQAAVQFGSLGLNADADADNLDVDEDREEAETRTQPPQHSPVAQPRAALPPAPRQAPPVESQSQDIPTPKQAPGLPPPPPQQQQQSIPQQSPSNPLASHAMQNQGSQGNQLYNQFGRYGQGGMQSEISASQQKSYDPSGQQAPQSSQYDYSNPQQQSHQQQNQHQQSQPPHAGAYSSGPDAFAAQYTVSDQQRSAYPNNYHNYGQQGTPSQHEAGSAQQRTSSGFGAKPNDSTFSQSHQQQQIQGRYNDTQNSGHNTPNPTLGAQHPTGPASQQGQQGQHAHQSHGQQGQQTQHGNYPYNHPYYGSPYYANYMNQYPGYGQGGGYGGFSKGMYQPQHHYGMSPQNSFDQHSSSPANVGGFSASSMHSRDNGLGAGLGDYGRSVSGASHNQNTATAGAGSFGGGGFPEMFSRPGYAGQNSYAQQHTGGNEEVLKPFGDTKTGGPSPSALGGYPGRPGSATNHTPGQGGLPQQQQAFGGYPGHLNQLPGGQSNQYGGLGGLGQQGAGSHQQSGYGGNYGGFGGGYGGGSYNRGGWGTNYGHN